MTALILAGGYGTRLQSVVNDRPKPMAIVNGKPFLEYILENLNQQGFCNVVLAVGYKYEVIVNYFGYRYKNIEIQYSIENTPLGTGGCIVKALPLIKEEYFYVLNGDTFFNINYNLFTSNNLLSLACKKMSDMSRYGSLLINEGRIIKFNEKKEGSSGYINAGVYFLRKKIFELYDLPTTFSIEKEVFEKYTNQIYIDSFISDSYFIDIGIPDDYEKVQEDFKDEKNFIFR
ncbi:MAG: nucleotidyltransferase family protein [Anaeroplasmataceae bacterium]